MAARVPAGSDSNRANGWPEIFSAAGFLSAAAGFFSVAGFFAAAVFFALLISPLLSLAAAARRGKLAILDQGDTAQS